MQLQVSLAIEIVCGEVHVHDDVLQRIETLLYAEKHLVNLAPHGTKSLENGQVVPYPRQASERDLPCTFNKHTAEHLPHTINSKTIEIPGLLFRGNGSPQKHLFSEASFKKSPICNLFSATRFPPKIIQPTTMINLSSPETGSIL